jgi:type IV pilus assembly protein PilC
MERNWMPVYYYKVGKEDGSILTNELEADSEESLRHRLEDDGYLVLELRKRRALGIEIAIPGLKRGIKSEDFLIFNQELLVLIRAGLPIVQSLDLLKERTPSEGFKRALLDVKSEVRGGKALSDAMAMHTDFFPELYCNSLRAGERTGSLEMVIERYIKYLKKMLEVKRNIIGALTLPAVLIGFSAVILAVLLTYVVPTFASIYEDFGGELPLPTRILLNTIHFIKSYSPFIAVGVLLLLVALRAYYRTDKGRMFLDARIFDLPIAGKLISGYYISAISRTLATILAGGIPMLEALEMVGRSITNRDLSYRIGEVQERVREGMSLAVALEEYKVMSPMTIRMVEVGEATGALEAMLENISEFYEDEVNLHLQRITTLIEPVVMIGMGIFVGAIVIAMYLPVFQLAGTIK